MGSMNSLGHFRFEVEVAAAHAARRPDSATAARRLEERRAALAALESWRADSAAQSAAGWAPLAHMEGGVYGANYRAARLVAGVRRAVLARFRPAVPTTD
jgi:hypothetical protein